MSAKQDSLIEIKGAMLPVLSVILRSLDPVQLQGEAKRMFGEAAFFDNDLAALDLGQLDADAALLSPDWVSLIRLFAAHGLRLIGTRGGPEALAAKAAAAGLAPLAMTEHATRPQPTPPPTPTVEAPPPVELTKEVEPPAAPQPATSNTIIIDRPLRSGQRVYARGGDIIVLDVVSAGAEVIADGSIHVYAPLRGRALAGASGDTRARILTTCMTAELVSIAGLFRTFEDGIPAQLQGKPTQIRLLADGPDGNHRLVVEALPIG